MDRQRVLIFFGPTFFKINAVVGRQKDRHWAVLGSWIWQILVNRIYRQTSYSPFSLHLKIQSVLIILLGFLWHKLLSIFLSMLTSPSLFSYYFVNRLFHFNQLIKKLSDSVRESQFLLGHLSVVSKSHSDFGLFWEYLSKYSTNIFTTIVTELLK